MLLLAVRLVAFVALRAVQARRDLRPHAHTVSHLDCRHLGADLDRCSHDFYHAVVLMMAHFQSVESMAPTVTRNNRPVLVSPTARRRVQVGTAHSAACNFDVDVVFAKGLGFELELMSSVTRPVLCGQGQGLRGIRNEPRSSASRTIGSPPEWRSLRMCRDTLWWRCFLLSRCCVSVSDVK